MGVIACCLLAALAIGGPVLAGSLGYRSSGAAMRRGGPWWPSLKWRVPMGTGWNASPSMADLDYDAGVEIVFGSTDGRLYCLSALGKVLWQFQTGGEVNCSPLLADVDDDGAIEVCAGSKDGKLYCLTPAGQQKWTFETGAPVQSSPMAADINGDGHLEILFGSNDEKLHCLRGDGSELWSYQTDSWVVCTPAAGQITDSPGLEVVFGSLDYGVYCLSSKGELIWKYDTAGWVQSSPCIADLDGDGPTETIIGSDDGFVHCINPDGKFRWKVQARDEPEHFLGSPVAAEMDRRQGLEVLVGAGSHLHCISTDGALLWAAPVDGEIVSDPVVAQFNNRGVNQAIVATTSGYFFGLSGYGSREWGMKAGFQCWSGPTVADLDRDGKLEVYLGIRRDEERTEGWFYQYETAARHGPIAWPTFGGDRCRTGNQRNAATYGLAMQAGYDYATAWEPFGLGARPTNVPPLASKLTMSADGRVDDSQTGNGNGLLDAVESGVVRVRLSNGSKGPMYGVTCTISILDRELSTTPKTMYLGRLPAGATKQVQYTLTAARQARLENPTLAFVARESGVNVGVASARIGIAPYLAPALHWTAVTVRDATDQWTLGNGNRKVDAGETVALDIAVRNERKGTAKNALAALASETADALVLVGRQDMGAIRPFSTKTARFHVKVARKPAQRALELKLRLLSSLAKETVQDVKLPIWGRYVDVRPPRMLLAQPRGSVVVTAKDYVVLKGTILDESGIEEVRLNGVLVQGGAMYQVVQKGARGHGFSWKKMLELGENPLRITALDRAGNSATAFVRVIRR